MAEPNTKKSTKVEQENEQLKAEMAELKAQMQ